MPSIVNVDQAAAWNGQEGDHWTENDHRYDATGRRIWGRFLEADLIGQHDRVLDIGCGTGKSTRDAARRAPSGSALGVDLSARMLERARERSREEGITNVRFEQADAQVHPFQERSVDIAISCVGCMFFDDPVAAFTNVARAVRPQGRLGLLVWRELERNDWVSSLRQALAMGRELPSPPPVGPHPFSMADTARDREILTRAGFTSVEFEPVDEPLFWGSDADDAFGFVRTLGIVHGLLHGVDEADQRRALENVRDLLAEHETDDGVVFGSSAWLITARRP